MPAIVGSAATQIGVPLIKRSPRPPMKASSRRLNQITPAGKPIATTSTSSSPACLPSKARWMPCTKWCGPQVNAIAIQAIPKCEKPIVRRLRIISTAVIVP